MSSKTSMSIAQRVTSVLQSPGRRLFAKNLAILAGGEILSRVLTAVAFIHLARVLNPSLYGIVELTLAVFMFLTLIVDQGFGTLGAREVARDPDDLEPLIRRIISAQILLAGAVFILLTAIVISLPLDTTLTVLLIGYALTLLGYPFIIFWVFQGRDQMTWVAVPLMLRQAGFAVIALLFVRSPEHVLLLPVAEGIAIAIAAGVSVIALLRSGERIPIDLRAGLDRQLFADTLPIGTSQLIWAVRMYLPTVLVGVLVGNVAVGLYGAAHRIVMVFQTLLEAYFKNLFPSMSQVAVRSPTGLATLLRRSMFILMVPILLLSVSIAFAAPKLIGLIFGAQYVQRDTVLVLAILIWMIPILAWRRHGRNGLIVLDQQREELICSVIGVIVLVAMIFPLTSTYGVTGTAVAMVVSELAAAVLAWWRTQYHITERRKVVETLAMSSENAVHYTPAAPDQGGCNCDVAPIFILGAPRSGTSLLRVMLNRHPAIALCDETYYFYYVYSRRHAFGDLRDISARRHAVSEYLGTSRVQTLGLNADTLSHALLRNGTRYDTLFLTLMQSYAVANGKTRYGEKTPQHSQYVETLLNWYPNCRVIHIVRDPRDVAASLMRMPWASDNVLTNARTWRTDNSYLERVSQRENYLCVRYESLVQEPARELARICSFVGETYSPAMLDANEGVVNHAWWFQRALQPVTKDRIEVWRQQLSPHQIALVEMVAGEMLHTFGYEASGYTVSMTTQVMARLGERISWMQTKLKNIPHLWYYWFQPTRLAREEAWIDGRR